MAELLANCGCALRWGKWKHSRKEVIQSTTSQQSGWKVTCNFGYFSPPDFGTGIFKLSCKNVSVTIDNKKGNHIDGDLVRPCPLFLESCEENPNSVMVPTTAPSHWDQTRSCWEEPNWGTLSGCTAWWSTPDTTPSSCRYNLFDCSLGLLLYMLKVV